MRSITRETIERRLSERVFMYEPSLPPTIPAGMTAADWRRAQPRRGRRRRTRGGGRR